MLTVLLTKIKNIVHIMRLNEEKLTNEKLHVPSEMCSFLKGL